MARSARAQAEAAGHVTPHSDYCSAGGAEAEHSSLAPAAVAVAHSSWVVAAVARARQDWALRAARVGPAQQAAKPPRTPASRQVPRAVVHLPRVMAAAAVAHGLRRHLGPKQGRVAPCESPLESSGWMVAVPAGARPWRPRSETTAPVVVAAADEQRSRSALTEWKAVVVARVPRLHWALTKGTVVVAVDVSLRRPARKITTVAAVAGVAPHLLKAAADALDRCSWSLAPVVVAAVRSMLGAVAAADALRLWSPTEAAGPPRVAAVALQRLDPLASARVGESMSVTPVSHRLALATRAGSFAAPDRQRP